MQNGLRLHGAGGESGHDRRAFLMHHGPSDHAMRKIRDHRLPDPFRAWIDLAQPLPEHVTVLPREVDVSLAVMRLAYPGLGFLGMGVAFIVVAVKTSSDPPPVGVLAFLALSSLILFGVPVWLVLQWRHTLQARRDQRADNLRQGVLVGQEGVLVRLKPNSCYPVPMDRVITASEWSGGGEDGTDWLRIETKDGPVDLAPNSSPSVPKK